MEIIVYVETNFLMSVAMGREAQGENLLSAAPGFVSVAIPSGCYMESFSAFEDEQQRRNSFRAELDRQIVQLRRDITSKNAGTLLRRLEESRIANDELLDDVQTRLFQLVDRAGPVLVQIPATASVLGSAVSTMLIPDPTDNLILHSIIDHANRHPAARKALLTGNSKDFDTPDVQTALAAVGIGKPFRTVSSVLGWLGSLSP